MKRVALAGLLSAAFLAGCGGGENLQPEPEPEARAIPAAQVIERFRQAPGHPRLRTAAGADAAWEQLGLGLNASQQLLRRYGTFTVYVVRSGRDAAVRSLLSNKETRKPLEEDERGIYWEYDTLARSWVANSRYGANVVLAWWNEKSEPGTDARWERLHEMMSSLLRG
ncbi:MAG: hypothetical protein ACRDON_02540 [Gaiellaceae bacterium]